MKVLVAGDFCPGYRVAAAFEREEYASVLGEVRSLTAEVDYSIVNFECPVVTGNVSPIEKQGPSLHCSTRGVEALKYAGFDCVTLANNHFRDYGDRGIQETLFTLNGLGIDYVGGGMNLIEASRVLYKTIDHQRIAIVNCCEREFSIATNGTAGSNPLNPIQQYYEIKDARMNADHVLVIVHGGHELFQLPSPRMVETYRFFIDAGADAVINHHQHCYSGYEIYRGKPIFYGLGNFCFDECDFSKIWTEGYAVTLDFSYENPIFTLHPYIQCSEKPCVSFLPQDAFHVDLIQLNAILSDQEVLKTVVDNYYASCKEQYSNIFEPIYYRYFLSAKRRKWLPSLISKQRKIAAADYILCDSHRDKLMYWLEEDNRCQEP